MVICIDKVINKSTVNNICRGVNGKIDRKRAIGREKKIRYICIL